MTGCRRRSPWSSPRTTRSRRHSRSGYRDWQLLAEHVELHELADGGHYFLRTRPAEAAQAVLRAAALLAVPMSSKRGDRDVVPLLPIVTARPGPAARQAPDPAGAEAARRRRRAGRPSTATRCATVVAEHGSVLVRGLGLRNVGQAGRVFRRLAGRLDD